MSQWEKLGDAKSSINSKYQTLVLPHQMVNPQLTNPWFSTRYVALRIQTNIHQMNDNYLNILPKFEGEYDVTIEDRIATFQEFTNDLIVEGEDAYNLLFV